MNREILFKGKKVDNEDWAYGYVSKTRRLEKHKVTNRKEELVYHITDWVDNMIVEQVISETIGQLWIPSIGIRLFGGDLIEAYCAVNGSGKKTRKCKVIETDKGHSIVVWHKKAWWAYSYIDFTSIEAIGNIHDTPKT
ncbi:hypothetical protein [Flavobacterium sp. JP2137]|uniref:hypothetical protein n=1 Tax=Flavobacterium sp. JP2137 TaxID=3414510 RepID=UPI003D2FD14C